jgi:hypothetical protein
MNRNRDLGLSYDTIANGKLAEHATAGLRHPVQERDNTIMPPELAAVAGYGRGTTPPGAQA